MVIILFPGCRLNKIGLLSILRKRWEGLSNMSSEELRQGVFFYEYVYERVREHIFTLLFRRNIKACGLVPSIDCIPIIRFSLNIIILGLPPYFPVLGLPLSRVRMKAAIRSHDEEPFFIQGGGGAFFNKLKHFLNAKLSN